MILDIVQLPNRICGSSQVFSTKLPDLNAPSQIFGRDIPLQPFQLNHVKKYKIIEQHNNAIYEKLFLSYEDLNLGNYSELSMCSYDIYPLQVKRIGGHTYKYRNGIANYIIDNVMDNQNEFSNRMRHNENKELNQALIICPDFCNNDFYDYSDATIDAWLFKDVCINSVLYNRPTQPGMAAAELGKDEPMIEDAYLYDNNPICGYWDMYALIEYINSAFSGKASFVVSKSLETSGVKFEIKVSPNNNIDDFKVIDMLISRVVNNVFSDHPWTKIEIKKLWSEEIFINIYDSIENRTTEIVSVLYIDLIPFILGSIELY